MRVSSTVYAESPDGERLGTVAATKYATSIKRAAPQDEDSGDKGSQSGDEDEGVEDEDLKGEVLRNFKSDIPTGLFGRAILDESHKLKSSRTRSSRAVALMACDTVVISPSRWLKCRGVLGVLDNEP